MKINGLYKSFGTKIVVNDVSFTIPKGKVTALIGPNGAGKSTVLNMITRLIARDAGRILIDDKDLADYQSHDLAKRLAILTQTNHITMKLTVRELVAFGRFPHAGSRLGQADWAKVDEAIAYMEMSEFSSRFIDELSGGQRQRAYIAMVLAQDTEYVFLDEPTNNLDIYHSSNMMKLCRKFSDELGKTVILVLHEINFAACYSDYIGAFKDGALYQFDTVDKVMTAETLKALYQVDFQIQQLNGKPVSLYY
ncbi:ATP-binding cassette domain-containing protein [Bengtsoniella intestinalis]|uniref:iron ABC transporter ATP-binding protein n=1 Tax=Bengtsoniella intestinalis TaxID=3073143 RepID=UPI00391FC4E7